MIIPNDILKRFEQETGDLLFGKVTVSVVKRGSHCHYEINKYFTLTASDDPYDIHPAEEQTG